MKAFVDFLILLMSSLSLFWNLLWTFLNFMLCTMSRRSASNLSSSLFCGGHFLDLKPKLSLFVASLLSCPLRSKKKAFHLIRLIALSTDMDIIMHCRKSLLFDNETAWTKKNHSNMFDVTMGNFDGAEVCELIGLFLLNNLSEKYGKDNVGLYRDDGLVLLRNASGPQSERTRKDITREFKEQGLSISISTNLKKTTAH